MKAELDIAKAILGTDNAGVSPVGSRFTCEPAPTDTDTDILCLIFENNWDGFTNRMSILGIGVDGSEIASVNHQDPENEFRSYKFGNINLICTPSISFYKKFLAATSVAKHLNLLNKQDRITLFQAVLYGNVIVNNLFGTELEV